MKEIFAQRLKNARIMEGLSMEKLAEKADISKQMVSKYEHGLSLPDSSVLIRLAASLNQKADYFFNSFNIELGPIEFRKKSSLGKKKQDSIKKKIQLMMEHYLELEDMLSINYEFHNPFSKININNHEEIEQAAEELREQWDLGQDPIYSIVSLLEEHEIKIIEIDEDLYEFDGLSAFIGGKNYPVIVVNKNMPVERKRFTLLHELAHLLFNIPEDNPSQDKEKLCHSFSGALLLPRKVIVEQFGKTRSHITFNELFSVQKHFGISVPAIIYRLYHNRIISQNIRQRFFMRINKDKQLKDQINEERYRGEETTDRFKKLVYQALAQGVISTSKAAAMLEKSVEEIRDNFAVI